MESMFIGVSGMQAHQKAVSVIGNNVANLNTVAYKAGRISFQDQLVATLRAGSSLGTNPMQVGGGVSIGSIDAVMTAGVLRPTNRTLDLSVVGSGFFVVDDGANQHYTRAGVFQMDADNRIVLAGNGMRAVGWRADIFTGAMDTTTVPSNDLRIPLGTLYAVSTANATFAGNLNAAAAVGDTATVTFDAYDSLGTAHRVDITFEKTAAATWEWTATSPDAAVGTTPGSGTLTIDAHGNVTAATNSGPIDLQLATPNGAEATLSFVVDFSAVSQLDGEFSVQTTSQDGLRMGTLDSYSIDTNGQIFGTFSSGATRLLGQLALAHFTNPAGLQREGNNLWSISPNSGSAVVTPASASASSIRSGYLEQSNVDLTAEFTELIVAQRGFQANSRSITTADDMLQEVLQLKR
ncbi:MAG TPA: flagellar hook protein FlgE [Armatimonadota bacterium]|nr:flagellar hook protein FlgE [Armatimonadota bacterium]HOS42114.1 flagellar hook protein FlgE [Armatimonadota bacterium]